jgi:hypothetical protein
MNKYLLMSAAAALATTAAGAVDSANAYSLHFSGYCDGVIGNASGSVYAARHTMVGCGYPSSLYGVQEGLGAKGAAHASHGKKKKGNVNMGDTLEVRVFGTNIGLSYDFSTPVAAGSSFYGWASFSGVTSFNYISGVMASGAGAKVNPNHNLKPTVAKLSALIKAHKNSK